MVCSFCWCAEFEDKLIARRARRGTTSTNEAGIFSLREFPRIQLNYHLDCNQNLELCSSTVLCCSAVRSRYDGSTLNPRYQVRTCTAHYSVLKFRWQFYVYRGCPTYTVFTTADPTTVVFGLCTCVLQVRVDTKTTKFDSLLTGKTYQITRSDSECFFPNTTPSN